MTYEIEEKTGTDLKEIDDIALRFPTIAESLNAAGSFYCAMTQTGDLVGIAHVFNAEHNIHLKYMEVDPSYKQKGVARFLTQKLFTQATSNDQVVSTDGFTSDGRGYLHKIFDEEEKKHGLGSHVGINRA